MSASEPTTVSDKLDPRHKVILGVIMVSTFVVFLNETALGVALPQIMEQLGIQPSTGQWLNTAYMLTMAVIIPTTGFLLQRFSTKPMYIAAMTFFTTGTLVAALSQDFLVLLIGRILQASGTAIMMPLLMTTVMVLVPEHLRGRINGNISLVLSAAPALGPAFSGLVLSVLDWRWLFWIMLPIGVVTLIIGTIRISNSAEPRKIPIDVFSVILSAFAFSGLIYGLSSFADDARGVAAISPWIPLGVGIVFFVLFLQRQNRLQKTDSALLDLRTFLSRSFSEAMGIMGIGMLILFGAGILIPIYMQNVLGVEPLTTGLMMLPGGLAMGLLGPVVGRMYDKYGPQRLLIPGSIAVSVAFWTMTTFGTQTSIWFVFGSYSLLSIGLAFLFTPLFALSLSSVPPQLYSYASATIGTLQQLAGAAGTALFVTVMTIIAAGLRSGGANDVEALAGGMRSAFLIGAIASLGLIAIAVILKRPASTEEMARELQH
jgi:DHA2 family lincomycin resistance protein-like MFS transporter